VDWALSAPSGEGLLNVTVGEEFLAWVRARAPELAIDPYRNTTFDRAAELRWRDELVRIAAEHRSEVECRLSGTTSLPADRRAREQVLGTLIERELARMPEWRTLADVQAVLDLALEVGQSIVVRGD
jgi:hypothetical protein